MKSLARIAIAFLMAAISGSAFGRLGQTEAALDSDYGRPFKKEAVDKDGLKTSYYNTAGFIIMVQYRESISVSEIYSHQKGSPLYNREIKDLLYANRAGTEWTEKPGEQKRWERNDGRATAVYMMLGGQPMLWVRLQ